MGTKFIITGTLFILIFLTGVWLRIRGKPYSMLLVTVHKLIGLGTGFYLGLIVYRAYQAATFDQVQMASIAVTVLLFAVDVATGSLLSTEKEMPRVISIINKVFPFLALISTAITIYILA